MIKPLGDRVVLRLLTKKLGMIGDLYVPEMGRLSGKTSCECEVVSVGKDVKEIKAGNIVHVSVYDKKAAGTEIEYKGEKLILIEERNVNGMIMD